MPYRAQEEALRARGKVLRRELAELVESETQLRETLEAERISERQAAARLADAGPGGGLAAGARRDRIDVAALVLAATAIPFLYFQFAWHRYITRDATVIPALLWLVTPALLAVIVAWPYRARSALCTLAVVVGVALCAVPLLNLLIAYL